MIVAWVCESTHIGIFDPNAKKFDILHRFTEKVNVVQACCNASRTLLLFVKKTEVTEETAGFYQPFLVEIKSQASNEVPLLEMPRSKQVMAQFTWGKRKNFEKSYKDKFLVMIHEECVLLYTVVLKKHFSDNHDIHSVSSNKIDFAKDDWYCDKQMILNETIARSFIWCQWDPVIQALFYIHYKPSARTSLEKEEQEETSMSPTLSAFQFHDDLPTETVVMT